MALLLTYHVAQAEPRVIKTSSRGAGILVFHHLQPCAPISKSQHATPELSHLRIRQVRR